MTTTENRMSDRMNLIVLFFLSLAFLNLRFLFMSFIKSHFFSWLIFFNKELILDIELFFWCKNALCGRKGICLARRTLALRVHVFKSIHRFSKGCAWTWSGTFFNFFVNSLLWMNLFGLILKWWTKTQSRIKNGHLLSKWR